MTDARAIVLRACTPDDAAALLELWRRAGSSPSTTDTVADVTRAISHAGLTVLAAEADGLLVGCLIATWDGWRGNFYRLAVLPGWRRRGVAAALVREGERLLAERGARRLSAIVLVDEAPAMSFWAAAGYLFQDEAGRYTKWL
jgi:ribosomal protein S18 acetylase RimI-like enzyme